MKNYLYKAIFSLLVFLLVQVFGLQAQTTDKLCVFNVNEINNYQNIYFSSLNIKYTETERAQIDNIFKLADKALKDTIFSVTFKKQIPPSGDKHDYMSLAPYWFPDSTKADGLPYIRSDGVRNPEAKEYTDNAQLNRMSKDVINLSVAFAVSKEKQYVDKANQLLRAWFLDSATRMNPTLNFAQAVKGRNDGRGAGLIESRVFISLLDAVELLRQDLLFEKEAYPALKQWFTEYLEWMETSENGRKERAAKNNHGTWYTAQYARIALFVGRNDLALKELETLKERIVWQIEPDGKQPLELKRTKSLSYSLFNLEAYFISFSIADKLGLYLWNYETTDGRSVKKALDYVLPYADKQSQWPEKQIKPVPTLDFYRLLKIASLHYKDSIYSESLLSEVYTDFKDNLVNILY